MFRGFWRIRARVKHRWLGVENLAPLSKSLLLFALNWVDAQLTIVWIRLNVATEGNALMARVLEHSELSFLGIKFLVGGFAAYILYRGAHVPLARKGMTVALGLYLVLMLVHTATGFVALGWRAPLIVLGYFGGIPGSVLGLV